jgi:hypothetical protein
LYSYDDIGFGDVDLTAYRLGIEQPMSRKDIRDIFGQANSRYIAEAPGDMDLRQTLRMRVDRAKLEDPQFIEVEVELASISERIISTIKILRGDGRIEADMNIPSMRTPQAFITALRGKFFLWHIASLFSPVL